MDCIKCEEPAVRSIMVHNRDVDDPPPPDEKDRKGVRVVRLCKTHWREIERLLPTE
jgi:hypothetical protein